VRLIEKYEVNETKSVRERATKAIVVPKMLNRRAIEKNIQHRGIVAIMMDRSEGERVRKFTLLRITPIEGKTLSDCIPNTK
jgi:Trk K+ transport system NAD-binding subunit